MTSKIRTKLWLCAVLIVAPLSFAQAGESGFYLGGSVGSATIEAFVDDGNIPDVPPFDEEDFAWKVILGYNFGITPVFDLGIEGGYVNLGNPSGVELGFPVELEATGLNLFGVIGFDIGPVGLFGKVGYISWDVEGVIDDVAASIDGSDLAYGVGLRFNLANFEIRGEYELYDIEDAEDVNMYSVGLAYHFN
jgi:outer membrane immunogenic protein